MTRWLNRGRVSIVRNAVKEDVTPVGRWFVMDGYSPVAMQEQLMRWWLANGRPVEFTIYPAKTAVRIAAAGTFEIGGMKMQGYTISGLIWGEESLWIDRLGNLAALVSTDAEFDHFEAVREPYAANLGAFIAAAARAELAELNRLTAAAKSKRLPRLAIRVRLSSIRMAPRPFRTA